MVAAPRGCEAEGDHRPRGTDLVARAERLLAQACQLRLRLGRVRLESDRKLGVAETELPILRLA